MSDENVIDAPSGMALSQKAMRKFKTSGGWAMFLGIFGFIMTLILLITAFSINSLFNTIGSLAGSNGAMFGTIAEQMGGIITFVYLLYALLVFFPSLFLFRYGMSMRAAMANNSEADLETAAGQISMWAKFSGIVIIVFMALYLILFLLILAAMP